VLGIVSFVLSVVGVVTAILAIVFGRRATRAIRESGGRLEGGGMAKAGVILGIIYLCLAGIVMLAAVVFVLVTEAGDDEGDRDPERGGQAPSVAFTRQTDADGSGGTLTVVSFDDAYGTVPWSDIRVEMDDGEDADCNLPSGDMSAGDQVDCRHLDPGATIVVQHVPSGEELLRATFG
jgi:hypothetical protein